MRWGWADIFILSEICPSVVFWTKIKGISTCHFSILNVFVWYIKAVHVQHPDIPGKYTKYVDTAQIHLGYNVMINALLFYSLTI